MIRPENPESIKEMIKLIRESLSDDIRREVGAQIRSARDDVGINQTELAEILGRRQAYVSELETGKTEPDVSMILQLSLALNKPAIYFIPDSYRNLTDKSNISTDDLDPYESELIHRLRALYHTSPTRLAVNQMNALLGYFEQYEDTFEDY